MMVATRRNLVLRVAKTMAAAAFLEFLGFRINYDFYIQEQPSGRYVRSRVVVEEQAENSTPQEIPEKVNEKARQTQYERAMGSRVRDFATLPDAEIKRKSIPSAKYSYESEEGNPNSRTFEHYMSRRSRSSYKEHLDRRSSKSRSPEKWSMPSDPNSRTFEHDMSVRRNKSRSSYEEHLDRRSFKSRSPETFFKNALKQEAKVDKPIAENYEVKSLRKKHDSRSGVWSTASQVARRAFRDSSPLKSFECHVNDLIEFKVPDKLTEAS